MTDTSGIAVIGEDLTVEGHISRCRELEVRGQVQGGLSVGRLIVHAGGRVFGTVVAESAEVNGSLEGDIRVKNLIAIGSTGVVAGNVRYGQLSLAAGGDLAADVRNIPPELAGDFEIVVKRGSFVRVSLADLNAFDPDDSAGALTFAVSNAQNGHVALAAAPQTPVARFPMTDLANGNVVFVHDGRSLALAGFDVVVTDHAGATSGPPRRVTAAVVAAD